MSKWREGGKELPGKKWGEDIKNEKTLQIKLQQNFASGTARKDGALRRPATQFNSFLDAKEMFIIVLEKSLGKLHWIFKLTLVLNFLEEMAKFSGRDAKVFKTILTSSLL